MNNNKNSQSPVILVLACDDNYTKFAGVTIESVIKCSSGTRRYEIYVFHTNVKQLNIKKIESLSDDIIDVKCIDVSKEISNIKKYLKFDKDSHFSEETYYRFVIPDLLGHCKKVLYIDCDLVVLSNIEGLFDTELSDYYVGAVFEPLPNMIIKYEDDFFNIPEKTYFNAGVSLYNIEKFIECDLQKKCYDCLKYAAEKNITLRLVDQDVLNIVAKNKVYHIDNSWNTMTFLKDLNGREEMTDLQFQKIQNSFGNPKILHYASVNKPWNDIEMDFADLFWKYATKSIFYEDIFSTFISYYFSFLQERGYKVNEKELCDKMRRFIEL